MPKFLDDIARLVGITPEADRDTLTTPLTLPGREADSIRVDLAERDRKATEGIPTIEEGYKPFGSLTLAAAAAALQEPLEKTVQRVERGEIRLYPTPALTSPFLRSLVRQGDVLKILSARG